MSTISNEALKLTTLEALVDFVPATKEDYLYWRKLHKIVINHLALRNRAEKLEGRLDSARNAGKIKHLTPRVESAKNALQFVHKALAGAPLTEAVRKVGGGCYIYKKPDVTGFENTKAQFCYIPMTTMWIWRLQVALKRIKALRPRSQPKQLAS